MMERSHRQASKAKNPKSNAPKSIPDQRSGGKEIASAAYDEYLWLLQKRNRLLKRLKTKDEQQVALEKKEQGFSVYINGANREFPSLPTSRQTKTADEHSSSRKLLASELELNEDAKEKNRAKTAPTKLTRKEWKPMGFKIKTDQGEKLKVKVPGNITGIYSEDFDEVADDVSESEESEMSDGDSDDEDDEVQELSLSFNDVPKLRRSLERDSRIQESIQTVIECDSFIESDEDKPLDALALKDIEDEDEIEEDIKDDDDEHEEIEEDIETADTSLDLRDVLKDVPQLRGSYVIYEDTADEALRSARPVIGQNIKPEEDTIVLSFSKASNTRGPQPLSKTSRKKQESGLVHSSQDVFNAVALENNQAEFYRDSSKRTGHSGKIDTSKTGSELTNPISDETVAMVTKKVRTMNASQQKQLMDLLAKLDPTAAESISAATRVQPSIAFGSSESSPTQSLSPREDVGSSREDLWEIREAPLLDKNNFLEVLLEIRSNWGHPSDVGLTEVQFFDKNGLLINVPKNEISSSNKDRFETSLSNLVIGKTKTTNGRFMWKCPYTTGEVISLTFKVPCEWEAGEHNISRIKVWNYNKKMKDLSIGAKEVRIFTSGSLAWDGVIDKGCGNQIYDYAEEINLKSTRENRGNTEGHDSDMVVHRESPTFHPGEDAPRSPDIVIDSSIIMPSRNKGPKPILQSDGSREIAMEDKDEISHAEQLLKLTDDCLRHYRTETFKFPKKPPWLDEMKDKRSSSSRVQSTHPHTPVNWLDQPENDKRKDLESGIADDLSLLEQPRTRSRPTSGRRSSRNQTPDSSKSSRRTTPRPESGRRSVEQTQEPLELHEQLTKLCVGDASSPEENPVEQEKWLEESLNSLSQFRRCHQGRITPSNKIEIDRQGDALDDILRQSEDENENSSPTDDFIIPELPTGRRLVINILTTWGDQYYVGLNGIEVFSSSGKPVQISKITADPSDINILPEYSKDPRVVSNLIDGVYFTRDDMHLWLAPFTEGRNHLITMDFKDSSTLAMIRIWNYNKSRIHSFRGVKDVEIFLDDNLIFRGEMARASGELGSSETFGDTILFTVNEEILEAMAANDQTYEPDIDDDEDFLQTSNNFRRPVTADTGAEMESLERPFTCPKERRKPTLEATYPNKVIEEDFTDGFVDEGSGNVFGQVLELNLVETWGDIYYLGLSGLQILGSQGEIIDITLDMLQACPKDLNDLPEYEDDDRTLDKLLDGVNVTMSDEHMWLIPFVLGENHLLTVSLKQPMEITGLRVWNYNKSPESTYRGVKRIYVKLDGRKLGNKEGILVRKGPGHCNFDFGQEISFVKSPRKPEIKQVYTPTQNKGDCELTVKPCGFVFQFQLFGSWGDPYYLGLNGLQFFDEDGKLIELSQKNVTAYPDSVNVLEGVKDDVRTPAKLIDGINDTDDGRHMWLAPVFPGMTNLLYVVFDQPTTISMIKLWNYRKTPIRGVRQFSILVDDLLVFNGILPQVPTGSRGILPNMNIPVPHAAILFTDDETIRRKEKSFVINGGGFFESQEVALVNDKRDFQDFQEEKKNKEVDQAMRPKTSVTHFSRTRR
ncbi:LOW QUALITY PROTEIN: protein KIAA0556-like [Dendronephthya gigantea]|uniref:LOW QUALITY PROTEIN: protein KIAA0556-like n=1 Tax=Dendronephthya gigantea TaxID=151771 RepID=UPI00106A8B9B|nr:LOW QUALITY PROTEIN: protein KIAA0556-like [Dendronephthya gigantea]